MNIDDPDFWLAMKETNDPEWNATMDGLHAFAVALVAEGFDPADPKLISAVNATIETCSNNF